MIYTYLKYLDRLKKVFPSTLRSEIKASLVTIGQSTLQSPSRLAIVTLRSASKASLATIGRHSSLRDQSITRDCPSTSAQRSKHHSRLAVGRLSLPFERSITRDYRSEHPPIAIAIGDRHSSLSEQGITRYYQSPLFAQQSITSDYRSALFVQQSITRDLSIVTLRSEIKASLATIGVFFAQRVKHHSRLVDRRFLRSASKASLATCRSACPSLRDQSITRDCRLALFAQRSKHHSRLAVVTLRSEIKASLATIGVFFAQRVKHHSRLVDRRALRSEIKASLVTVGWLSSLRDQSITRD